MKNRWLWSGAALLALLIAAFGVDVIVPVALLGTFAAAVYAIFFWKPEHDRPDAP